MINPEIDLTGVHILTERLELRPFEIGDLKDFYEYAKEPGVGEAAGWPHHQSIEESLRILELFIAERKTFAIVYIETGCVIGSLGLEESHFPPDFKPLETSRELGYVLKKEYWGQGLMSEAVHGAILYCFGALHLDVLTACHFPDNQRSQRVIEKAGFTYLYSNDYETRMGTVVHGNRCYYLDNPTEKEEPSFRA